MSQFASRLIAWQRRHGRSNLPWQGTRDPYRIWLSEVMLQQTQVTAVIPYYQRFIAKYPSVAALAGASEDSVLRLWSGLGYYARARNLHSASRKVVRELKGKFPDNATGLAELPRHAHAVLGRRVLAEHEQHRVTHEAEQRERDQTHRQHDQSGLREPSQDKGEHWGN